MFLGATLAAGLGDNSRIKRKLNGEAVPREQLLLGIIADRLGILISGLGGTEAPPSLVDLMYGIESEKTKKQNDNIRSFASAEDFEKARNELLKGAI